METAKFSESGNSGPFLGIYYIVFIGQWRMSLGNEVWPLSLKIDCKKNLTTFYLVICVHVISIKDTSLRTSEGS